MNKHKIILEKLESFSFDSPDTLLTFSDRLARENLWDKKYSARVIKEYKRFIYLACVSNEETTPSDEIDQAWHLHLTYTQSYWQNLCRDTLGIDLHHKPTKGGMDQESKYRSQYESTLKLYEKVYSEKPPTDIWPNIDLRFKDAADFVRVNKNKKWFIPKPNPIINKIVILISMPIFLVACTENFADQDIWFWLKAAFGVYIIYKVLKWLDSGGGWRGGGSGCSTGCSGCGGGCGG